MNHKLIGAVFAGHFAAAFAALGMPPFYQQILQRFGSDAIYLAGWFFIVPTVVAALANPFWGKLADRFGKKRLLLRAHLGLACSFWLTSLADNPWQFALALVAQGFLGGTFAASNAYLALLCQGRTLTRLLTLMQGSARSALFVGPALIGFLGQQADLLLCYRFLALLPLLSALLIWQLPADDAIAKPVVEEAGQLIAPAPAATHGVAFGELCLLQLCFLFATVATFPYFVPFAEAKLAPQDLAMAGLLFGLPHLVYLLAAFPLSHWLGNSRLVLTLLTSQVLVMVTLLGQAWSANVWQLLAWRTGMGVAVTASYIALHGLAAGLMNPGNAGRRFGALEGSTKWGAVAAGLSAGIVADRLGPQAPFYLGAGVLGAANLGIVYLLLRSQRTHFDQPKRTAR